MTATRSRGNGPSGAPWGTSLLEVLVAMLVVATGALGLVGLQFANAQNNRAALHRSLATMLAGDMLERMRRNAGTRYPNVGNGAPGAFVDCLSKNCSPAEVAAFDISAWKCSLGRWNNEGSCEMARRMDALPPLARQRGLPMGDGTLTWDAGGFATVTVSWQGPGAGQVALAGRP